MSRSSHEGHLTVPGGQVWYQIVGTGDAVPLLTLHGGIGLGHDYLEPLAALASQRPVIFFDQLGCGKSDKPNDLSLWRIERFVEEVSALRTALKLDRVHLFGHSWGGWLAIEYMLRKPAGVLSLTLASTSAAVSQFAEEARRLKATLPQEVLETLNRFEAVGDFYNPEYQKAMTAFYTRFVCRLDPWPEPLLRTLNNFLDNPIPNAEMIGPSLFAVSGNLKHWDRCQRLSEITVPTLITCGRHDEMGPVCAQTLSDGIRNAQMQVFEQSAHMAHLEETQLYLHCMRSFLGRIR